MDPEIGQRGADTDADEFGSEDGECVLLSDAVVQALESAERDAFGRESPVSAASDAYDEMFTDGFSDEWMHAWARLEAPCGTSACTPTLDPEPPSSLPPSSSIAPSRESEPPPSCDSGPTEFNDMFLDNYTDQWLRACSVLATRCVPGARVLSGWDYWMVQLQSVSEVVQPRWVSAKRQTTDVGVLCRLVIGLFCQVRRAMICSLHIQRSGLCGCRCNFLNLLMYCYSEWHAFRSSLGSQTSQSTSILLIDVAFAMSHVQMLSLSSLSSSSDS
ncbi:unnamed protein product [Mycena citricolor]|uniref:Uncharacterized protein n=1 Tax=Mycena citricolor TaxID=2018698 RepID=A0AAD2HJE7_9AGAR|nr:unnamed protein product [Mycena citricolor]CAK5276228.1 unnamed protein product [Mycena citricolor]